MTLLINGFRPEIKMSVMQHLPFQDVEALITKARHIESALKTQGMLSLPSYSTNLVASSTTLHAEKSKQADTKHFQNALETLTEKFEQLSKQLSQSQRFKPPERRVNWQPQTRSNWRQQNRVNYNQQSDWRKPWAQSPSSNRPSQPSKRSSPQLKCWKCDTVGHQQRDCPKFRSQSPAPYARARSPDGRFRPSSTPRHQFKEN